jgi:AcrR family transcriptional regulator
LYSGVDPTPKPHKLPGVSKPKHPPENGEAGLPRLPPGRHGLSREFVVKNQRDRLAAGMIQVTAEHGYHDATITLIAAAAGVSRRTFYGYFDSKEDCFLAAYTMIAQHLVGAATEAAAKKESWPERVRAAIGAALAIFAANPDLARFMLIAPPRAGEPIAGRYHESAGRALALLSTGVPADVQAPSEAVQNAIIGGMAALVGRKVEAGEGEHLPELLPDLVELFLTPYVGRERAAREAHGR